VFRGDRPGAILCQRQSAQSLASDYSIFVYLRHGTRHLGKQPFCVSCVSCVLDVCYLCHLCTFVVCVDYFTNLNSACIRDVAFTSNLQLKLFRLSSYY